MVGRPIKSITYRLSLLSKNPIKVPRENGGRAKFLMISVVNWFDHACQLKIILYSPKISLGSLISLPHKSPGNFECLNKSFWQILHSVLIECFSFLAIARSVSISSPSCFWMLWVGLKGDGMGWHDHIGISAEGISTKRGCLLVARVGYSFLFKLQGPAEQSVVAVYSIRNSFWAPCNR